MTPPKNIVHTDLIPLQKTIFAPNETYHIFNRSVAHEPIFTRKNDCQRILEIIKFYLFSKPKLRFSFYNRLPETQKSEFITSHQKHPPSVEILTFSLMPNHIHLLIKEKLPQGTTTFISNVQNSFAKYYNITHKRTGYLYESTFKSRRIETEEELVHISRYIHLNPLTSFLLKNEEELTNYPWSSYRDFLHRNPNSITSTEQILSLFKSVKSFREFTQNQVDYQRHLAKIKHLLLE